MQIATAREYVLTIDCIGDRIAISVDGVATVALTDESFASGNIGLYASTNSGATFREVIVSPLQWNNYYVFGAESMEAAGSRLRVFSGNASAAPAPTDNVSYRFVATLQDACSLHFNADMVYLRLVDQRAILCMRAGSFAPSVYGALNARVLRGADGTGFALIVPSGNPAGTQLQLGQYRIGPTYLLDNTAAVPTSQVLSENGSTQPELVELDVPWLTTS